MTRVIIQVKPYAMSFVKDFIPKSLPIGYDTIVAELSESEIMNLNYPWILNINEDSCWTPPVVDE